MEIRFLNVDLELESSEDLQPIIEDFGKDVSVLYNGQNGKGFNFASFVISDCFEKNADEIISSFCNFIEKLSPESNQLWRRCHSKRFDIGFQSGDFPNTFETEIRADTIKRVTKLGASIIITIYPKNE